jgi:hypothetical protein
MAEGLSIFSPPKAAPNASPAQPIVRTSHVRDVRQVDGTRSSPDVTPAQARWQADKDQLTAEDPWRNPDIAIVKDPKTGIISTRPRTDRATPSDTPADIRAQPGEPPQPQPGPASVANGKLVVGQYELSEADIASLMSEKAARDSRAATAPKVAADYSLDLPENFQLPANMSEWKWNLEDPTSAAMLGQAKNWAFAHGLDQTAFSDMLGLYAATQISDQQRFATAQQEQVLKLGVNAPGRIDAVNTWLEAQLGSDLAGALRASMFTAKSVEAFESLLRRFVSQGVSGSPSAGRDGEHGRGPQRVSDEVYNSWSYSQRQAYAAQFDQAQFNK